jgi:hypothetical protein
MDSRFTRRTFLGAALSVPLIGAGLAGCAVVPAATSWLGAFATSIAAGIVVDYAESGIENFEKWVERMSAKLPELGAAYLADIFVRPDAPVAFVGVRDGEGIDPDSDRLVAFVKGAKKFVEFPPWAWHAIALLCAEYLDGLDGEKLDEMRSILGEGLAPSATKTWEGTTPAGSAEYLTYKTVLGKVELVYIDDKVTVTVFGLYVGEEDLQLTVEPDSYEWAP